MQALELRIPPPVLALVLAAAMWGVASLTPTLGDEWTNVERALAGVFFVAGAAFPVLGFRALRSAGTTVDPVRISEASELVTGGIYRFTRNPMYLGLACLLIDWALFLGAPWALLGPALFVAFITRFQIIPEERMMAAKFTTAYADYRRQVRRWI